MLFYGIGLVVVLVAAFVAIKYFYKKESFSNETVSYVPEDQTDTLADLMPEAQQVNPEDLLPTNQADVDFANSNPYANGDLNNQDFLDAGRIVGVLSEVLQNSVLDIRGVPVIEREQVSPWNNSTKAYSISQSIGDHI